MKASAQHLNLNIFCQFSTWTYNKNKLYKILDCWCRDMLNFDSLEKCLNKFSTTFCVWFSKKNIFHVIFYQLTKFHCLIAFTSWNIGQYVYCSCLLTRVWRHNFEIKLIFLIKPFFYMTKKSRQKFKYREN